MRTWTESKTRLALLVSVALHAVLIYAVSHASWAVPEMRGRQPRTVVWLNDWRPLPDEDAAGSQVPAEQPVPQENEAPIPEAEKAAAPSEVPPIPPSEAREPETKPRERVLIEDPTEAPPQTAPRALSEVDWDEELRKAVARAREAGGLEEGYVTFSFDDLPEKAPEFVPNPVTKKMFDGHCIVTTSALKQRALTALGLCARLPFGDLFAEILPDYLTKRPLCAPVDAPLPALLADAGHDDTVSNIKCRLVSEEEYAATLSDSPASSADNGKNPNPR